MATVSHKRLPPEQDRVVAMHEGFDADRRFFLQPAGVITGPLAERSFIEQIVWMDEAFKSNFCMRRNRQAGTRSGDHLHGFADQSTRRVEFVPAIGDFQPGDHEQSRMHAAHDRNRAGLAAFMIAAADQIAVLAL